MIEIQHVEPALFATLFQMEGKLALISLFPFLDHFVKYSLALAERRQPGDRSGSNMEASITSASRPFEGSSER